MKLKAQRNRCTQSRRDHHHTATSAVIAGIAASFRFPEPSYQAKSDVEASLKRMRHEDERMYLRVFVSLLPFVVPKCIHQVNELQITPQPPSWFGTDIAPTPPPTTDKDFQLIRDLIEAAIFEYHCPPCKEEEWLSTKQTTKALSISEPTLRGMRRRGEIRSLRVGQAYRYQLL